MSPPKVVTKAMATRYRSSSRAVWAMVLDELCELTGWQRDHARKALREALGPRRVPVPRRARAPVYGEDVMVALRKVWAVMDVPAGKGDGAFLSQIVGRLRACGELDLDDEQAAVLRGMSAATIDRRLAGERKRLQPKGRSGTKPGGPGDNFPPMGSHLLPLLIRGYDGAVKSGARSVKNGGNRGATSRVPARR